MRDDRLRLTSNKPKNWVALLRRHKSRCDALNERISDAWMDGLMGGFKRVVSAEPHRSAKHLGELWGRLNWFHGFAEGNGRATQPLLTVVARRHGRAIDWPRVDADAERQAAIASVRNSFGAYEALLIGSLVPLDNERALSQLWLKRDSGAKS